MERTAVTTDAPRGKAQGCVVRREIALFIARMRDLRDRGATAAAAVGGVGEPDGRRAAREDVTDTPRSYNSRTDQL